MKGSGVTDLGLDSGPGEDGSVDEGTLNLVCRDESILPGREGTEGKRLMMEPLQSEERNMCFGNQRWCLWGWNMSSLGGEWGEALLER